MNIHSRSLHERSTSRMEAGGEGWEEWAATPILQMVYHFAGNVTKHGMVQNGRRKGKKKNEKRWGEKN